MRRMRQRAGPPAQSAERELRRRLAGELDAIVPPAAPVDAIIARGRARRARRRSLALSSLAAVCAVAAALALTSPGPKARLHAGPGITVNPPDPRAPGGVFASGTARGTQWRLAVRDIADPGARCLPAVMLNGHDGDVLARAGPAPVTPIADVAFLTQDPLLPTAGFAFVLLRRDVNRVVAHLRGGASLAVRPVTVFRCGERLRLAGFAYPARGVREVTAGFPGGHAMYTPPAGLFSQQVLPPGRYSAGLWSNSAATQPAVVASGRAGSGRVGDVAWTVTVTLGSEGQCYVGALRHAAGTSGAQPAAARIAGTSVECEPPESPPPPTRPSWLPIDSLTTPAMTGYAGTVSAGTASLVAELADGATQRLTPSVIGGRKYFALVLRQGTRVRRLTFYNAAGHRLGSSTLFPAV